MKELIHQRHGDYIFWKKEDVYSILFLSSSSRKQEKEYQLKSDEVEKYLVDGLSFIQKLVVKKGG